MLKRIICWLCVLALIPALFVSAFAVVPFTDTEVDQHTTEKFDGTVVTDCLITPNQFYHYQLWETQWNNYIGDFYNESRQFQSPSICGRIRPFGNELNFNIGSEPGYQVKSGYYMPLPDESITSIDFMLGFNIKFITENTPVISDQVIYGTFYFCAVNSSGVIVQRYVVQFRYQWVWHSDGDALSLYCLLKVPFSKADYPKDTVGFIPLYTFRTIETNHDINIIFFPDFSFSFNSSLYDNLWDDLGEIGSLDGGILGYAETGMAALLSGLAGVANVFKLLLGKFQAVTKYIDNITSIGYLSTLFPVSIVCGCTGAFLGIGVSVLGKMKRR